MRRRTSTVVMLVILAIQTLVFFPAAATAFTPASASEHCSGSGNNHQAPCCPHGMSTDCATMCAAILVNIPAALRSVRAPLGPTIPFIPPALITHIDVPLDPPPIC